jgi:hypothetical protein
MANRNRETGCSLTDEVRRLIGVAKLELQERGFVVGSHDWYYINTATGRTRNDPVKRFRPRLDRHPVKAFQANHSEKLAFDI